MPHPRFEPGLPSSPQTQAGGSSNTPSLSRCSANICSMRGRRLSYTEQEAREAIAASKSWAESLRQLGLCPTGGAWRILKKYAREWRISTEHFDARAPCGANLKRKARPLPEVLVAGSTYGRQHVKRRLLAEGLKEPLCELCGQGEIWQGRPMSMILDHINGVRDDHRLENLRMVCPNCAATLDTHCGRRNRIERAKRTCLHCKKEFVPSYAKQRLLLTAVWGPVGSFGLWRQPGGAVSSRGSGTQSTQSRAPAIRAVDRGDRSDELPRGWAQARRFRQCGPQVGAVLRATEGARSGRSRRERGLIPPGTELRSLRALPVTCRVRPGRPSCSARARLSPGRRGGGRRRPGLWPLRLSGSPSRSCPDRCRP